MTRYQQSHYEDVAATLYRASRTDEGKLLNAIYGRQAAVQSSTKQRQEVVTEIAYDFADLFAADNPDNVYCGYCGTTQEDLTLCAERQETIGKGTDEGHSFVYHKGFDRERFLAACGLESEP